MENQTNVKSCGIPRAWAESGWGLPRLTPHSTLLPAAPSSPRCALHPAAQARPATLPRMTTWTAATAPEGPSTHPCGARASPPPTPASVPPARTSGPTGNGASHVACLRPAGPHTDLSGVPHAPRLRRPVSCRHPAPATGRPLPVPAGSRARTRQKKPGGGGGQGRAAGRAEGETTHTWGQETGGRGGRVAEQKA